MVKRKTLTINRPKAKSSLAFSAASSTSQELAGFNPPHSPVDTNWLGSKDKVVSRVHDLVRNDGWASGGVTSYLDTVIGADLRLSAKPDWRALKSISPSFDAEWAKEYTSAIEAQWRSWAYDVQKFSDASRQNTIGEMFCLAFRHKLLDGDCVAIGHYDSNRGGKFSTFVELMHPDRLSNPDGLADDAFLRGGVARDHFGAANGYHFRGAHSGDGYYNNDRFIWSYVPRERSWGRQNVVHHFEKTEAHQTRGVSKFAPIVERLKMLTQYDRIELQAAVLNSVLAAYITSPMDHSLIENALANDPNGSASMGAYQEERASFHETTRTNFNGARIPVMFPGESIETIDAARPNTAFTDFESTCLRNIASGLGMSYEQLSKDWSKTNYSSGRMALTEIWRTYSADRMRFSNGFATPIYALLVEECIDKKLVPMPTGADYWDDPTALTRCKWIGPARGWIDPVKEATAAQVRMEIGVSTLEDEAAEQGKDYEDIMEQRAREKDMMEALGLKGTPANDKESVDDDATPDE